MRIRILLAHIVSNKKANHELDCIKLKRRIISSWQKMPRWAQERYDRNIVLLFQVLAYNQTLTGAVKTFRKKFGFPRRGISFKKNETSICRIGKGPLYRFDSLVERKQDSYSQEQQFIENFQKENVVLDPFKIHLQTIFYAGFVDISFSAIPPISCSIPEIPQNTADTIFQYRPPVAILINSRDLSREEVKQQVDKNWPAIQQYFRQHPFITDVPVGENNLYILALKQQGKTAPQILDVLGEIAIRRGDPVNYRNSDVSIRKSIERAKKEINKLIFPRTNKA